MQLADLEGVTGVATPFQISKIKQSNKTRQQETHEPNRSPENTVQINKHI